MVHWKKYGKVPYDHKNPLPNAVYIICFFIGRRTLLLKKDLSVLCTFETRKVKQMLEEAKAENIISYSFTDCPIGERPDGYPKKADFAYWVETNKPI